MHIRALQVFVELAASTSIRQAAQKLSLSPTAIARLVDSLEYYFRAKLIDRSSAGIELTEAGKLLNEHARSIVNHTKTTRALIDDLRGLQRGQVTISAAGAVVAALVAPVLCTLHQRYPNLRFQLEVARTGEVFAALGDGLADIGITLFSPPSAESMICHRYRIRHAVIASPSHALASLSSVSMKALVQQSIATPDASYAVRQDLERMAKSASVTLDPVFITGSLDMQKELAIRSAAILILPPICCRREIEAGTLIAIPFASDSLIHTSLDLCRHPERTLSFAARAVLDALVDAITADVLPQE